MEKFKLLSKHKKILADTLTPVSAYLKLRDVYPHSLLLESSDYHANNNDFSYICCNPIASIQLKNNQLESNFPDGTKELIEVDKTVNVPKKIQSFAQRFQCDTLPYTFVTNGLFGYIAHNAVDRFENLTLDTTKKGLEIPDIYYAVYENIIAISLFNHEAYLISNTITGEHRLEAIETLLRSKTTTTFRFNKKGDKSSNLTNLYKKGNSIAIAAMFFNWSFPDDLAKVFKAMNLMYIEVYDR